MSEIFTKLISMVTTDFYRFPPYIYKILLVRDVTTTVARVCRESEREYTAFSLVFLSLRNATEVREEETKRGEP